MDNAVGEGSRTGVSGAEMEYGMLREEILRRIDQRQQILSITLTLAAAFLGIGWGSGAVALLIYPPLATLLGAAWSQNELRISRMNTYIRDYLEGMIPGLGYERYSREQEKQSRLGAWPLDVLAIGGIFVLTQLMAIGLSLFHFNGQLVEWLVLLLAIASIGIMLWMLESVRRRAMQ